MKLSPRQLAARGPVLSILRWYLWGRGELQHGFVAHDHETTKGCL